MSQITFNLSKTSRSPGWDPNSAFHDDLWENFAAGYRYSVVGGNGTQFDSTRASDPATRGTTDTFQSSAGSLDLTAANFAGNVSLDWLDGGATARLALDSAWNTIKNAFVGDFTGQKLILENWVDVWIALDNDFGQTIFVDGAKRAEVSTGSGDDTIWVGVDSNGAGWTNVIKVDGGDGNDTITIARATHDYSGSAFQAAYNPVWTRTDIHAGEGNDSITGSESSDTADGGSGTDIFVVHGARAFYQITVNGSVTDIIDIRVGSANRDGIDHLTNIERVQFDDQIVALSSNPSDGDGTGALDADFPFDQVVTSPSPFLFTSTLDFGNDPFDTSDIDDLTPAAQQFLTRSPTAGGSSLLSEVFSVDVLARAAGATLIKTESEITYEVPGVSGVDYTAEIAGKDFAVAVVRAAVFPEGSPLTLASAGSILTSQLDHLIVASANVSAGDQWDETILHVFAIDEQAADTIAAAWGALDPAIKADTALVITQTNGVDQFLYF